MTRDEWTDVWIDYTNWRGERGIRHIRPEHDQGQLADAAACYASPGIFNLIGLRLWPWSMDWWKPKDRRSNLVRAGALILAEIERLDRAQAESGERS